MNYRADIDGLRALAVLSVLLFHAGVGFLPGGFAGVDVFFVISGFLITSLIVSEINDNRFSIARFYERRARRLLPALFLVFITVTIIAPFVLSPGAVVAYSKSLWAAMLFVSNFWFATGVGYFSDPVDPRLLLHTWSLAVEEQYYLVYPVILVLSRKLRLPIVPVLIVLTSVSFAYDQYVAMTNPQSGFFSTPARFWELCVGGILAVTNLRTRQVHDGFQEFVGWGGLFIVVIAFVYLDGSMTYPGIAALLPVVGTACIIVGSQPGNTLERMLSAKPFVALGLISYSTYLWHYPIFVYVQELSFQEPAPWMMALATLVSLVLAALTWRFVEQPFRNRSRTSLKQVVSLLLVALVLIFSLSGVFYVRSVAQVDDQASWLKPNFGRSLDCGRYPEIPAACVSEKPVRLLLWGDSFAMHLSQLMDETELAYAQRTRSLCGALPGFSVVRSNHSIADADACVAFNQSVVEWIDATPSLEYVVVGNSYSHYLGEDSELFPVDSGEGDRDAILKDAMVSLSRELAARGITLVVVAPPPATGANVGNCLRKAMDRNLPMNLCDMKRADVERYQSQTLQFLRSLQDELVVLDLQIVLCDETSCAASLAGIPLYRDSGHLTIAGSRALHDLNALQDVLTRSAVR